MKLKELKKRLEKKQSEKTYSITCHKCKDLGYIRENGYDYLCSCQIEKKKGNIINDNGLNVALKDFDINVYDDKKIATQIKRVAGNYIERFPDVKERGIYMHGLAGSGKTLLSTIIISEISRKYNITARQTSLGAIKREIQKAYNNEGGTAESIIRKYIEYPILLIDDIGTEKVTESAEEILFAILDERLNNKKTTFFTSNLEIKDLNYDYRIISRIESLAIAMKFLDVDVRVKKAANEKGKIASILFGGGDNQ